MDEPYGAWKSKVDFDLSMKRLSNYVDRKAKERARFLEEVEVEMSQEEIEKLITKLERQHAEKN